MTYTEIKTKILNVLTEPDSALANIDEVLSDIEKDYNEKETLASNVESLNNKVNELRDVNMRLYLNQSGAGDSDDGEDDEVVGDAVIDEFINKVFKEEE